MLLHMHYFILYGLSNIPLCMCVFIHVCVCMCLYISHIFFICSYTDRYLGCSQVMAVADCAVMNIGVHIPFLIRVLELELVFFGLCSRMGLLDHMVILLSVFKGTSILFSCCVRTPKTVGSWWRGLTECDTLEKGMANHFSILPLKAP